MAMTKKAGTELQTGVTSVGIQGLHEQSASRKQTGELKTFKDREGKVFSVYAVDKGKEISFEALIATSVADKEVGDSLTVDNTTYYVSEWTVTESNEDAKKVSCTARHFPDLETSGNGSGAGSQH